MLLYIIVTLILSFYVSWRFKSKVKEYSQVGLANHLTGAEIAQMMLKDNGIFDVEVLSTDGELTDHYNPEKKIVNLSNDVFHGRRVIAEAVSAHECEQAVQNAKANDWLKFR